MSLPYMPFYVGDYLADTCHLSTIEHGAYLLLIMHYWRTGALPKDEAILMRICRMKKREWDRCRDSLHALFRPDWSHKRIDAELDKGRQKSAARSQSGKTGAAIKALKNKDTAQANASGLLKQPEPEPDSEESSSFHSEDSEGSLRSPSPREEENPESGVPFEQAERHFGKIAEAESSLAQQRARGTKAGAKPTQVPTAGKIAKRPREPVQGDLIAEDAKRIVVESLKAFRSTYPVGIRHPHDEAAWQKVGAELSKALKISPATEILAGAERYAASGENFDFIRDPRNWLRDQDWRKPWPKKTPRAAPLPFQSVRQRTHDSIRAKIAEWTGESGPDDMKDITSNTTIIEG